MGGFVKNVFGSNKPEKLKEPQQSMPTKEELDIEAQKSVAAEQQKNKRRKGASFTILTGQGGKTLLGE